MGFLEDIADELKGFVAWLWNKAVPPEPKPWCAAFYFCSQEVSGINYPENTLDQKMADSVAAVIAAAADVKDSVWVAYRTVPSRPEFDDPLAQVVSFLGPSTGTLFFPDCYDPGSTVVPLDTEKDLTCFLEWVYRWCPADHYAIFIWGHSFGPAGLFEPGSEVHIPKPGLAALRRAFEKFQATRVAGDPKIDVDDTPLTPNRDTSSVTTGTGTSPEEEAIEAWAEEGNKKVEVVLFLDCWMSTLETAFELADTTECAIASQSPLPIGRLYANFLWPYDDLLKLLLAPTFAVDMTNRIAQFYRDHIAEILYLESIHIALLDLSAVATLSPAMATLVTKLATLPDAELSGFIEPSRLVRLDTSDPFDPIVLAGDSSLIDIPALCNRLNATMWPAGGSTNQQNDAHTATGAVITALASLINPGTNIEVPVTGTVGFLGVSAFDWPPLSLTADKYISDAVIRSVLAYKSLQFVQKTGWYQIARKNNPINLPWP